MSYSKLQDLEQGNTRCKLCMLSCLTYNKNKGLKITFNILYFISLILFVFLDYLLSYIILAYLIIGHNLILRNYDYLYLVFIPESLFYIIIQGILMNMKSPNKPGTSNDLCFDIIMYAIFYKFIAIFFNKGLIKYENFESYQERSFSQKFFYHFSMYFTWIYLALFLLPIQVIGTIVYSIYKLNKIFVFSSYRENPLRTFLIGFITLLATLLLVLIIYLLIKLYKYLSEVIPVNENISIYENTDNEKVQV